MPTKHRKIAIMGYRSVGKSCLTIQYVDKLFVDSYDPSIENIFTKRTKIRGQDYCLKLVDTAGQDEYSIFPSLYAIDIHGYCLVYSIDSQKSFEVVRIIYDKLSELTSKVHIPIVLVGNKMDLSKERVVPFEEGKKLANYMKAAFMEVSAKHHSLVDEMFQNLVAQIEQVNNELNHDNPVDKPSKCSII
uniref:GTP-binding protein Rheb n=1 Tax=Aceria tosichella TaxID=561515 RepID=A0A6G1SBQ4_9ACAR